MNINIKEILIVGVCFVVGLTLFHLLVHFVDWLLELVIRYAGFWALLGLFVFGLFIGYLMQKWPEDSKF